MPRVPLGSNSSRITAEVFTQQVTAWRAMHSQGRGLYSVLLKCLPDIDLNCGGHQPAIVGALYHPPGAIARHDAVAWAYALTLGFGLVYLGEHYLTDLLAGAGLVEAVRRADPLFAPAVGRVSSSLQRLEQIADGPSR